jgi:hypothetical protein
MRLRLFFVLLAFSVACESEDPGPDPCDVSEDREVLLGQGVGSAFQEFEDEEVVGLNVAPQGGFGVPVEIITRGLLAGDGEEGVARLEVEVDGMLAGSFELTPAVLMCQDDGTGGRITGNVVGFDPDIYDTNDELVALDGTVVVLDVTVTDSAGHESNVRKSVTICAGC